MIFYKQINKHNQFCGLIGELIDINDIKLLDNSCIAVYETGMRIGNIVIAQQNKRGFVSVKHIVDTICDEKNRINKLVNDLEERAHVRDLLNKFDTSIQQVNLAISCLISGRRIKRLTKALNLIHFNQKNGTGSWFIFLNVDVSKL